MSVKEDGRSLRIRFCWIWRCFVGPAVMCLAWNTFVVLWYWSALRNADPAKWLAVIVCAPHAAIGLFLVYATLAGFLNRTVIQVTSEFLTVRHGPVPWWDNRRLPIDDIERLSCRKDADAGEHARIYVYAVAALTKGASKVDLLTHLDRAQARFIHQELERWLKIGDHGSATKSG